MCFPLGKDQAVQTEALPMDKGSSGQGKNGFPRAQKFAG